MGPPSASHAPLEEAAFARVHETVALGMGICEGAVCPLGTPSLTQSSTFL